MGLPSVKLADGMEFFDILKEDGLQEKVVKYVIDRSITKVRAFADLADDDAGIVATMARASGLAPADPTEC